MMVMLRSTLLRVVFHGFFLGFYTFAGMAVCKEENPRLSERQRLAIKAIVANNSSFVLLRAPGGRLTLIVGENHLNPQNMVSLRKEFQLLGVEAPDIDKYLGGRLLGFLIVVGRKGFNLVTGASIADEIPEDEKNVAKHKFFKNNTIRNLEFGHIPDWREHALTGGVSGLFLSMLGLMAGDISKNPCERLFKNLSREQVRQSHPIHFRTHQAGSALMRLSTVTLSASLVGIVLGIPVDSRTSASGLNGNRNVTMARAAADWNSSADGNLAMAIIVGRMHVDGVAHHLRSSHGYQDVILDSE